MLPELKHCCGTDAQHCPCDAAWAWGAKLHAVECELETEKMLNAGKM